MTSSEDAAELRVEQVLGHNPGKRTKKNNNVVRILN